MSKFMESFEAPGLIKRDAASGLSKVAIHPVVPVELPSIVKVNTCSISGKLQGGSSSKVFYN